MSKFILKCFKNNKSIVSASFLSTPPTYLVHSFTSESFDRASLPKPPFSNLSTLISCIAEKKYNSFLSLYQTIEMFPSRQKAYSSFRNRSAFKDIMAFMQLPIAVAQATVPFSARFFNNLLLVYQLPT